MFHDLKFIWCHGCIMNREKSMECKVFFIYCNCLLLYSLCISLPYILDVLCPVYYICITYDAYTVLFTLVRNDMDVNEHERLQHHITQKLVLYCCSTFQSHSIVFNTQHNSYPKMSVKQPIACSWEGIFNSVDRHYTRNLCPYNIIVYPICGVINKKTKYQ